MENVVYSGAARNDRTQDPLTRAGRAFANYLAERGWEEASHVNDERLRRAMKSALYEMREPTEAMLKAGAASQGYLVSNRTPEDRVRIILQAAIDEVLKE